MRLFALIFLLAGNLTFAGESALLASGARIHIDRHEIDGAKLRLFNGGGSIELDAAQVLSFEEDEAQPPVAPAAASPIPSARQLADAAADKYGLPRQLVRSVISAESGFRPQAVSPKGALGLMQLMPQTAQTLGIDARDSVQNVDAGTRYLRELLEKYHGALYHALAAYNAGPGAVDKYNGIPPFPETLHYVSRIAGSLKGAADPTVTPSGSDQILPPK